MTASDFHPAPDRSAVLRAELRSVGIAIRPAVVVAAVVAFAIAAVVAVMAMQTGESASAIPEMVIPLTLLAPLLPIAVWRGEHRFRGSYLAAMPVDRTRHVLMKVAAGWIWMMGLGAIYLLLLFATAGITGGGIGVNEMRVVVADLPHGNLPSDPASFATRWRTPAWQWATFFTVPTMTYLLGSALVLVGRRIRRWIIGAVVGLFLIGTATEHELLPLSAAVGWTERILDVLVYGRFGMASATSAAEYEILSLPSGEELPVWRSRPQLWTWLAATCIWMTASFAALVAAARRK